MQQTMSNPMLRWVTAAFQWLTKNQFARTNCCFLTLRVQTTGNYSARIVQFRPPPNAGRTTGYFLFKSHFFRPLNEEKSAKMSQVLCGFRLVKNLTLAPVRNAQYWLMQFLFFPSRKRSAAANIFSPPSGQKNKTVCPIMKLVLLVSAVWCIGRTKVVSAQSVAGGESTWQVGGGWRRETREGGGSERWMAGRQQAARFHRIGTVSRAFVYVFGFVFVFTVTAELSRVKTWWAFKYDEQQNWMNWNLSQTGHS